MMLREFWKQNGGATSIEYGLIVSMIVMAILTVLLSLFHGVGADFSKISSTLTGS